MPIISRSPASRRRSPIWASARATVRSRSRTCRAAPSPSRTAASTAPSPRSRPSNGGVYGSLLATPILNAPQSGILGMHKIQERPVVVGGQIEARPMMYLALSYDHRIVDGQQAVPFLVRVKESLEDPAGVARAW